MKNIYLVLLLFFIQSNAQTIGLTQNSTGSLNDGYVLFAPMGSNDTYLIDKCGKEVNKWTSNFKPGVSCYFLPDGTLLRPGNVNNATFNAGGKGGVIQKFDWNGNLVWNYQISNTQQCQHHDVKALPNGNVLAVVWVSKTNTQAIAEGRDPNLVSSTIWSEKIIEIQPVGLNGGNIVWEWLLWDHLVQDFDSTKPNFNSINTNPQLVNINYHAGISNQDWIHFNSIDYNPVLDQIILGAHAFDEIWIIDHSTTTAEAATHSGGNSGKGGDLLYRWGNPQAYNNGTSANQKLFGQHNAHWIESGLPFENQIMIFNNGNGRTGGNYSTVEIINPPLENFNYTPNLPYLPNTTSWIYNSGNPNNFYAPNTSGAQQLTNGNVLFCNGPKGVFTEVTTTGETVWNYANPVSSTGVVAQGTTNVFNPVFRCTLYPSNYVGFTGLTLTAGVTIENTNSLSDACSASLSNAELAVNEKISIYPNPASDFVNIIFNEGIISNSKIDLLNSLGQIVRQIKTDSNELQLNISDLTSGMYVVRITNGNEINNYKIIIN